MDRKSVPVTCSGEPQRCVTGRRGGGVVVVLGCQPRWSGDGRLTGALGRRVAAARAAYEVSASQGAPFGRLVVSGGRTWDGVVEADAMRDELVRRGVPASSVLRERCSLSPRDNAWHSAQLLGRLCPAGRQPFTLVTCDWHMRRASALFQREGLSVEPLPVPGPDAPPLARWVRTGREWVSGLRVPRWTVA